MLGALGKIYTGTVVPAPTSGPTRPTPGVPFVSRRKEPKACGAAPLDPLRGTERKVFHFSLPLPLRCPHPLERVCATDPDRFATLRKVSKLVLFSPRGWQGSHLLVSSRGAVGGLRGAVAIRGEWQSQFAHIVMILSLQRTVKLSLPLYIIILSLLYKESIFRYSIPTNGLPMRFVGDTGEFPKVKDTIYPNPRLHDFNLVTEY